MGTLEAYLEVDTTKQIELVRALAEAIFGKVDHVSNRVPIVIVARDKTLGSNGCLSATGD